MLKLNLGCGFRHLDGYVNIDNRQKCSPDMLWDVINGLPYPDNSVDEVMAVDFLEHIPTAFVPAVIHEIWRVLKPGGKFESKTPSTDGRGAFQDFTHKSFWNINSWFYFMDDDHRDLYGIEAKFSGNCKDVVTNPAKKIIHTHCILFAVEP